MDRIAKDSGKGRKNKSVIGYTRVSSQGQINGYGFDRQEQSIMQFCKQNKFDLVKIYSESHTGTEENRPVFQQMIEDILSNGIRTIVIESLDRLARDLSVQMQLISYLISKDIALFSATTGQNITEAMNTDPMLKAMVQIQGAFAELEKSLLVRKLQKARRATKIKKGKCEGRKPYGYHSEEKAIVDYIKKLNRKPRNGKRLGPYQIASKLNHEGIKTRTGVEWHGSTIKKILLRLR